MVEAGRPAVREVRLRTSLIVGVLLAAGLIAASLVGARAAEPESVISPTTQLAGDPALLRGVPQSGPVLGSPEAPVTLVEYADLQCPYCAQWARSALPTLVRDYVRPGRVRLEFRGLAFVGADSDLALRTALAAGRQGRLWDVVHLLYANQGAENSGWVTQDLLDRIGAAIPGLKRGRMQEERWSPAVERELAQAAAAAERDGISGTPSFLVGPTGGNLEPVMLSSLDAEPIRARLDGLLAR